MSPTLAELARQAADRLRTRLSPGQNAALDAEVLARHVLGWDRARWIAGSRDPAPADFLPVFNALVDRRAAGEPVAYITGRREFWGLELEVSPDVLIPRPETELLVERALREVDRLGARRVLDIGTGSGCIAVVLAHERPSLRIVATDISERAVRVATRNALRHGVGDRVTFIHTAGVIHVGPIDLVVSNPPYIPEGDARTLMRDVVDFEPHVALFTTGDGLAVIRATLEELRARDPIPPYIFEFGGNEAAVRALVGASGLRVTEVIPDLQGIPRVAVVEA